MKNWYEEQAELSFFNEWEAFIKSAVGKDDIQIYNSNSNKNRIGIYDKWADSGIDNVSWGHQRFNLPKNVEEHDLFRTAILGRFSYPELADRVGRALSQKFVSINDLTYHFMKSGMNQAEPKNIFQKLVDARKEELKLLNNVSKLFNRQSYLLNQIEFVLALIRGANHYSQEDIIEPARKEILNDFYGAVGPKTKHKDGVKRNGLNRKYKSTSTRYKIIKPMDEALADAKKDKENRERKKE